MRWSARRSINCFILKILFWCSIHDIQRRKHVKNQGNLNQATEAANMIFTKITEQDLCSSPFLDKIPDWRLEATKVIQKSLQHGWLSVNFAAFLRKHIYILPNSLRTAAWVFSFLLVFLLTRKLIETRFFVFFNILHHVFRT